MREVAGGREKPPLCVISVNQMVRKIQSVTGILNQWFTRTP